MNFEAKSGGGVMVVEGYIFNHLCILLVLELSFCPLPFLPVASLPGNVKSYDSLLKQAKNWDNDVHHHKQSTAKRFDQANYNSQTIGDRLT